MLVLRFLLFFGLIAVVVSFGVFLFTRDKRYLRFTWQIAKLVGLLLLAVAAVLAVGRILLY
ncbi:MAG: hypothetical protein ACAH06_08575 [Methylophilaceae bacterium]|jgi:hypothetical protein|uniref:hypothetical protein n=1 Tax=Methylobacillus sp. MM3 TaxID=1848039 RepID=UPI0007E01F2D|nr:hypothetical protein [Methylobacillus sp. MM3]OAJ70366.1 hypothetical protein A7976_01695 [Methylobacillus sp. MM3]